MLCTVYCFHERLCILVVPNLTIYMSTTMRKTGLALFSGELRWQQCQNRPPNILTVNYIFIPLTLF